MIEITVQGKDMKECLAKLGEVILGTIPDEDIIAEARRRAHKQGLTVAVEMDEAAPEPIKVSEPSNSNEATTEAPKRRGRPPKAAVADAAPLKIEDQKHYDSLREEPPATNGKGQELTGEALHKKVVEALNAYAATHGGMSAGRVVMKEICGATRLVDCAEDDFPRLLAALGA